MHGLGDYSEGFGLYPESGGSHEGFQVEERCDLTQGFISPSGHEQVQRENKSRSWETKEEATTLVQMGNDGGRDQVGAGARYFCIYFEGKVDRCFLWIGSGGWTKARRQGRLGDFDMSSLRTELPPAEMEKTEGGGVWVRTTIHTHHVPLELQNHPTAALTKNENANNY